MHDLLNKQHPPSDEEVITVLGHSTNALYSVPTAIYCFLRTSQALDPQRSPLTQTLEYAISLGGDTDTIGAMACTLSGAFFGDSVINEALLQHCESFETIKKMANDLYSLASV